MLHLRPRRRLVAELLHRADALRRLGAPIALEQPLHRLDRAVHRAAEVRHGVRCRLHVALRAELQRLLQQLAPVVQPFLPPRRDLQRAVQLVVPLVRGIVDLVREVPDGRVVAEQVAQRARDPGDLLERVLHLPARRDAAPELSLHGPQLAVELAPHPDRVLLQPLNLRQPLFGGLPQPARLRGLRRLRLGLPAALQRLLQLGDALVDEPILRAVAEEVARAAVALVLRLQRPQPGLRRPGLGQHLLHVRPGVVAAQRPREGDHLALHGEDVARVAVDVRVGLLGDALPAYADVLAEVLPAGDGGVHARARLLLPLLVEGDLLLVLLVPPGEPLGLADALGDLVDLEAQAHQLVERLVGLVLRAQLVRLAQPPGRFQLEPLHPRGHGADGIPRLLQPPGALLVRLVGDLRVRRGSAALEVLRFRGLVDLLAPLRRAVGMHAGDTLQATLDLPYPLVEVPGEPDALLEVPVRQVRSIRHVRQVRPQLAVLAENARALASECRGPFQAALDVPGVLEPLAHRAVDLLQAVVHSLHDLEALLLQCLAAGERLLQRGPRLVPSRRTPFELDAARRTQGFVKLRVAQPVPRQLVQGDRLDPLALALARILAGHHPAVGLLRILHPCVAQPLVQVPAVPLQLVGSAVAHLQRPLQPVVALGRGITGFRDEMGQRLVEVALGLRRLAGEQDAAFHSLGAGFFQPSHDAAHGTLPHQLLEPAQRPLQVAPLDRELLQLGELLALEDLLRALEALEAAQRLQRAGVERVDRADPRALDRVLEAAAARQGRRRAGQSADSGLREGTHLEERQRAGQRARAGRQQHVLQVLARADGLDSADGAAHDALHHHAARDEGGRQGEAGDEQLSGGALQEARGRVVGLLHPLPREADRRVLRGRLHHGEAKPDALADAAGDPRAVQRIQAGVQRALAEP